MKEKNILRLALVLSAFCVLSTFTKAQVYINLSIDQPSPLMISAGTGQTICAGGNTPIGGVATGGTSPYAFSWSPSTGLSNATVANPIASPSMTTTYYLTVTDANNCKSMDSILITVEPCSTGVNTTSNVAGVNYFSIVPNPNRGSFSVVCSANQPSGQTGPVKLEIYNILGKRIYETSFILSLAGGEQLTLFRGSGLYLIKISHDNVTYIEKLIIE